MLQPVGVTPDGYFSGSPVKERYELMQYTGLKDKNGKEIYEGDIVKGEEPYLHVVEWKSWKCYDHGKVIGWSIDGDVNEWGEIIGNIYEDSHLLDKDK